MKRFTIIILLLIGCQSPPKNWKYQFDFDGDGILDSISTNYSGGAHCCYYLSIKMSSDAQMYPLDAAIEGGYLYGLDLSFPEKFNITDLNKDGIPEIKIQTASQYYEVFVFKNRQFVKQKNTTE
ncbi:MAG: hypothetical protein R2793_06875 [Flavobacteriaceae bacterium]